MNNMIFWWYTKRRQNMLLVTGGTGFVGGYILEALEGKVPRKEIRILARAGGDLERLAALGYDTTAGSISDKDDLSRAMQGVDRVIHLVAIIRETHKEGATFDRVIGEGTENVVAAAKQAGVGRFIYMSALGATNLSTGYYRNKIRAEEAVKASGIPYVIFRPSFLIGPGGEFTGLLKTLTNFPIVPVLGPGNYPVQPLYVRDMARYFAQALDGDEYTNQTFEVGGPETFSYDDMIRQTMGARGKSGMLLHQPLLLVRPMIPVIDAVMPKLITKEQFTMLLEGSATDDTRLSEIGSFTQTPFRDAIKTALTTPPPPMYAKARK
jgi:NADH dehydrogenase